MAKGKRARNKGNKGNELIQLADAMMKFILCLPKLLSGQREKAGVLSLILL